MGKAVAGIEHLSLDKRHGGVDKVLREGVTRMCQFKLKQASLRIIAQPLLRRAARNSLDLLAGKAVQFVGIFARRPYPAGLDGQIVPDIMEVSLCLRQDVSSSEIHHKVAIMSFICNVGRTMKVPGKMNDIFKVHSHS